MTRTTTILLLIILLLTGSATYAQDSTAAAAFPTFGKKTTLITVSFGLNDWNKSNYKMPDSTNFGSGTASLPLYIRAERAVGKHVGIGISLAYDVFYYGYSLEEQGSNGGFYRNKTDRVWVLSPGVQAYYHFNDLIPVHNLDVSIGAGFVANYVKHSNYPTSDSTMSSVIKPTIDPSIRLGVRYYINKHANIFGDVGYDKLSYVSLGFSYRLFGKLL